MGNQNPKPTLASTQKHSCQVQMLDVQPQQLSIMVPESKPAAIPDPIPETRIDLGKESSLQESGVEQAKIVLKQSNDKIYWPQNHIKSIKLPQVKPPPKKVIVKKTKQAKENDVEEGDIELLSNVLTSKSETIDAESVASRGKTAPLIKSNDNPLFQFGKTKKCRVSRMV